MLQYPFGTRQHQSSTRPNQSRYDIFLPCACCVYWETISSFGPYPTVSCNLLSYCFYLPLLHSFPSRFCALGHRELVLFVLFVGKTCERLIDQDIRVVFSGKLGIVQTIWFCLVSESFIVFELFCIAVSYIILIVMQMILVHRNANCISLGFIWLLLCGYWVVLKF